MKKIIVLVLVVITVINGYSQAENPKIYNPSADAKADIKAAITKAAKENKHVLIQLGGNWCSWCIKLHKFFNTEQKIDSIINADYVFILVNTSPENKNLEVMKILEYPQRFGYPVLVVLDAKGKRLHTQDSGLLEMGAGYDRQKVYGFLKGWGPAAMDPLKY